VGASEGGEGFVGILTLLENQQELKPEFAQFVEGNFWEILATPLVGR